MRDSRNGWQRIVLVVGAIAAALVLDVGLTYLGLTSRLPGANDFYVPWRATQAWLQEGLDPYGPVTTLRIQIGLFGQPQPPEEHQFAFAYPLYTLLPIIPLAWLPYAWAEAIWLTGLQVALLVTALLALRIYGHRPAPWLLAICVLWFMAFYPSTRAFFLGQWALPVAAFLAACLWSLRRGRDGWAGFFLALTTVKPQMVILVLPWLLWWTAWQRRWRFWLGAGATMGVMALVTLPLMPDWPIRFWQGLAAYEDYTAIGSPLRILGELVCPSSIGIVEIGGSLLVGGYVLIWAWRYRQASGFVVDWLTGLTIAATSFLAARTATTNQVVLVLPLAFLLRRPPARRRSFWTISVSFALLVSPWVVFLATVQARMEQPITYVLLPLVFTVWLVAVRRRLGVSPQ